MIKVEVRMNADLIKSDGKYEVETIRKAVDDMYMQFDFRRKEYKDGTVCYLGNDSEHDFAHFGKLIWALSEEEWFMKYVDRWLWYNNSCMPRADWFRCEDILEKYGNRKSAAKDSTEIDNNNRSFTEDWEREKKLAHTEGCKVGLATGRAEGLAEGRSSAHTEDARRFKAKGIPLDIIAECTGLPLAMVEAM